jgi:hypothetical protein
MAATTRGDAAWAAVPHEVRRQARKWFGANSGGDTSMPELWLRGANQVVPSLSALARRGKRGFGLRHCPWNTFNASGTIELKALFDGYGSDKGFDTHMLHHAYAHIIETLGGRGAPLRLLEVGLGTRSKGIVSAMAPWNKPAGGAVRSFRDFLPNAMVFGADVDEAALFNETRLVSLALALALALVPALAPAPALALALALALAPPPALALALAQTLISARRKLTS